MKPHLLDQEVIDMILRHATECIGTDGVDGLRGHIFLLLQITKVAAASPIKQVAEVQISVVVSTLIRATHH